MSGIERRQDQSGIDAILKALAERSNVHCTLILSRKDGSIIKATGFKDFEKYDGSSAQTYRALDPAKSGQVDQQTDTSALQSPETAAKPRVQSGAELLASSICRFVRASTELASDMIMSDAINDSYGSQQLEAAVQEPLDRTDSSKSSTNAEHDVQLLRMRTKKQEIIIFPDSSYLCCVIQTIGANASVSHG